MKKGIKDFIKMKRKNEPIAWVTAYDYPFSYCAEQAGIDMILVGDSGGMVQLGYETTNPVSMEEMLTMAKAVRKGAPDTFIIGDMPQGSYEISTTHAVENALRFIKESGCDAIKCEGGELMYRKGLVVLLFIFSISLIPGSAVSYNPAYTIEAVAGSTPNINGVIASGEWNDASAISFNNTIVYVKQDGENIYVAFNVSDNTVDPSQESVAVGIDVLNDGGSYPQSDDICLYIIRDGTLLEAQGTTVPPNPSISGWNGAAYSTGGYWQAEFNITYTKVQISRGEAKTLGVAFMIFDSAIGYAYFWPPMTPESSGAPSNWGDLTSEANWIPEFPSVTFVSLIITFTLFVVIFAERKLNKTINSDHKVA